MSLCNVMQCQLNRVMDKDCNRDRDYRKQISKEQIQVSNTVMDLWWNSNETSILWLLDRHMNIYMCLAQSLVYCFSHCHAALLNILLSHCQQISKRHLHLNPCCQQSWMWQRYRGFKYIHTMAYNTIYTSHHIAPIHINKWGWFTLAQLVYLLLFSKRDQPLYATVTMDIMCKLHKPLYNPIILWTKNVCTLNIQRHI